jgi:hypothetical protein
MRPRPFCYLLRLLGRGVPTPTLLLNLLFLLEAREHSVQVVLLDAHLGGQLGDGDTGLSGYELQGLGGTGAAALTTAGATTGRRCSGCSRSRGSGCRCLLVLGPGWTTAAFSAGCRALRAARTARATSRRRRRCCGGGGCTGSRSRPTDTCQRRRGCLEPVVLVDQRLQLRQSVVDLSALLVKEVSHDSVSCSGGVKGKPTTCIARSFASLYTT